MSLLQYGVNKLCGEGVRLEGLIQVLDLLLLMCRLTHNKSPVLEALHRTRENSWVVVRVKVKKSVCVSLLAMDCGGHVNTISPNQHIQEGDSVHGPAPLPNVRCSDGPGRIAGSTCLSHLFGWSGAESRAIFSKCSPCKGIGDRGEPMAAPSVSLQTHHIKAHKSITLTQLGAPDSIPSRVHHKTVGMASQWGIVSGLVPWPICMWLNQWPMYFWKTIIFYGGLSNLG